MSKNNTTSTIIDGIQVIKDGNVTHFIPVPEASKPKTQSEYKSVWQKICDWWNDEDSPKPYAKVRDLSDPFGKRKDDPFDDGGGSKTGVEVGIKFTF